MLRVENLSKSFGGVHAMNGVTLDFPAGSLTAIIGPNGAGKTTFFNLVSGHIRADTGSVWLDGESSDKWHTSWGGGIWIGILARTNSVAFTIAQSDERTAFYVRAGFSF